MQVETAISQAGSTQPVSGREEEGHVYTEAGERIFKNLLYLALYPGVSIYSSKIIWVNFNVYYASLSIYLKGNSFKTVLKMASCLRNANRALKFIQIVYDFRVV